MRYELGFYIPEDDILHGILKSYMASSCILLIGMFCNSGRAVGDGMGGVLRDVEGCKKGRTGDGKGRNGTE
jgi:hypothetical protein